MQLCFRLEQSLNSLTSWLWRPRSAVQLTRMMRPRTTASSAQWTVSSVSSVSELSPGGISIRMVVLISPTSPRMFLRTATLSSSTRRSRIRSSRSLTAFVSRPMSLLTAVIVRRRSGWPSILFSPIMPLSITVAGKSSYSYWLETNVGEIYLTHEVQVGLEGYWVLKFSCKSNGWDAYSVLNFVPFKR